MLETVSLLSFWLVLNLTKTSPLADFPLKRSVTSKSAKLFLSKPKKIEKKEKKRKKEEKKDRIKPKYQ